LTRLCCPTAAQALSPQSEWRKSWSYEPHANTADDLSALLSDFGLDPAIFYAPIFDAGESFGPSPFPVPSVHPDPLTRLLLGGGGSNKHVAQAGERTMVGIGVPALKARKLLKAAADRRDKTDESFIPRPSPEDPAPSDALSDASCDAARDASVDASSTAAPTVEDYTTPEEQAVQDASAAALRALEEEEAAVAAAVTAAAMRALLDRAKAEEKEEEDLSAYLNHGAAV